jgi:hypothetical protein
MNSRDDRAGYCSHKGFSEGAAYRAIRPTEENALCGQETSEGACNFMKCSGSLSAGSGVACWRAVGRGSWHQSFSIHPHPFAIQKPRNLYHLCSGFGGNKAPGSFRHRASRLDPRLASRRHHSPPPLTPDPSILSQQRPWREPPGPSGWLQACNQHQHSQAQGDDGGNGRCRHRATDQVFA